MADEGSSVAPLVQEGDFIRINYDGSEGGAARKVNALVLAIRKASEQKCGSWFRYSLRLEDTGEVIKTRLANLTWKPKSKTSRHQSSEPHKPEEEASKDEPRAKKRRVAAATAATSSSVGSDIRKRFQQHFDGLPQEIVKKRKWFAEAFPVEALRHILAPMVGASELPFRLLCRRYGATLAYTPMIHADKFAVDPAYRREEFQVTPEDRPLVAHFAANQPQALLQAAQHVANQCDAIDLNLGCPQRVACAGHFGSFLLDPPDRPLVLSIVRTLAENLSIPVFVKIRLLDKLEDTVELVQQLYEAGASLIAIHGRYRVNLTQRTGPSARDGPALLDQIQHICARLPHIPIISNGNVITYADVESNLASTHAYGIMSAEGILDNPALFSGPGREIPRTRLATEYLALVDQYPTKLKTVIFHVRRMCKDLLNKFQLMEDCVAAESIAAVKDIVARLCVYEHNPEQFRFDTHKAQQEKDALARRKAEEGKRKEFEARMVRKAKREGKPLDYYLKDGAEPPTEETITRLKSMDKTAAFEYWKQHHKQHCWGFHFDAGGCARDRKCSFLHLDMLHAEAEVYG